MANLRNDAARIYEFGHIDRSEFTRSLIWMPVSTTHGFWEVSASCFAVNVGTRSWQPLHPLQLLSALAPLSFLSLRQLLLAYHKPCSWSTEGRLRWQRDISLRRDSSRFPDQ